MANSLTKTQRPFRIPNSFSLNENDININYNYLYDKAHATITTKLLNIYNKCMILKIFIDKDDDDDELKNKYKDAIQTHTNKLLDNFENIDAGFDLFAPGIEKNNYFCFLSHDESGQFCVNKLDFKISCSAQIITCNGELFNTGYYMYPRSSLSKTPLRLANSVGIIDSGYRGHLIGMFDVLENKNDNKGYEYCGNKFDRYVQICAPGLVPIFVELVDKKEDLGQQTERGDNGFGSTGK